MKCSMQGRMSQCGEGQCHHDPTLSGAGVDLRIANRKVVRRANYMCGIVENGLDVENLKDEKAQFFFESPDGQDYELYMALRDIGYREKFFKAPYYWRVEKHGFAIEYVEGDVYLTTIK